MYVEGIAGKYMFIMHMCPHLYAVADDSQIYGSCKPLVIY